MFNITVTSPLPPTQVKRQNYLWNSVLWRADHRVCGCSVYTSLPCSVQSYRSSKRKKKSTTMDNFSTVRLASMYPLLCLNFHVLNQENRQIFLYKCLTKLSKGHSYIYIYIFFFFFYISFLLFWLCRMACGILVPWLRIEPTHPALLGQSQPLDCQSSAKHSYISLIQHCLY